MNLQDLLPDPRPHFGTMVSITGHIIVTGEFSYLVADADFEGSKTPQPALLISGSVLHEALRRDGSIPCLVGTEVLFAIDGELSGLLTFAGAGLFAARLIDLTTLVIAHARPLTLTLGPDRHTQLALHLQDPGPNRLLVAKLLRSRLSLPLESVPNFLSPGRPLLRGLQSELEPLRLALEAAGAHPILMADGA